MCSIPILNPRAQQTCLLDMCCQNPWQRMSSTHSPCPSPKGVTPKLLSAPLMGSRYCLPFSWMMSVRRQLSHLSRHLMPAGKRRRISLIMGICSFTGNQSKTWIQMLQPSIGSSWRRAPWPPTIPPRRKTATSSWIRSCPPSGRRSALRATASARRYRQTTRWPAICPRCSLRSVRSRSSPKTTLPGL